MILKGRTSPVWFYVCLILLAINLCCAVAWFTAVVWQQRLSKSTNVHFHPSANLTKAETCILMKEKIEAGICK